MSFADEDAQKVNSLLPLLSSPEYELELYPGSSGLEIVDPQAEEVKHRIGEKIVKCNIAVCLIGEDTHKSRWVDLCLEKNRNKGNKIIAMALKKIESAVLPSVVKEENLAFYPWDPERLKKLILEPTNKLFNNSP